MKKPLITPVSREKKIIKITPMIAPIRGLACENSPDMKIPAIIAASVDPVTIDKFMPPVRIAGIMARAISPNSGIWNPMFCRLFADKNLSGERIAIMINSARKIKNNTNSLGCFSRSVFINCISRSSRYCPDPAVTA